jgi:hypothetical protein
MILYLFMLENPSSNSITPDLSGRSWTIHGLVRVQYSALMNNDRMQKTTPWAEAQGETDS